MEIPLYQIFYDGEKPPKLLRLQKTNSEDTTVWKFRQGYLNSRSVPQAIEAHG
jgi:hypothetical protein